jgi:lipid A 3-O-deacylase
MALRTSLGVCAAAVLLFASLPARGELPASVAIASGQLGMRRSVPHALGIELQGRGPWRWNLIRPVAGFLTSSSGGAYVYSGVAVELPLPAGFQLTPGFAPGVVLASGDRDLGSPIEFRSSIELSVAAMDLVRVGLGLSHISNAGLTRHNPGVEVLAFSIAIPAGK